MNTHNKGLNIAGFRVTVEPLLPLVVIGIGWLLSERYFPSLTIGYYPIVNYILGGVASIMLTFSILFHELGHAVTAVRFRLQIERIHLYLFGGMAELKHRPIHPVQELWVALSGPIASILLSGIFYMGTFLIPHEAHLSRLVVQFLVQINFLLAVFNLIPIFPLDGGRTLRAVIWMATKRYYRASITTLRLSYVLIILILVLGVLDYGYIQSGYSLILLLLSFYLGYTVWSGRAELLHNPDLNDLVFDMGNRSDTGTILQRIVSQDGFYLPRTVIPVVYEGCIKGVIYGHHISNESIERGVHPTDLLVDPDVGFFRPLSVGDFIDVSDPSSYAATLVYAAEFIPVIEGSAFLGLCDANELRFWLLESQSKRLAP
jgi:Zn-dependent protease